MLDVPEALGQLAADNAIPQIAQGPEGADLVTVPFADPGRRYRAGVDDGTRRSGKVRRAAQLAFAVHRDHPVVGLVGGRQVDLRAHDGELRPCDVGNEVGRERRREFLACTHYYLVGLVADREALLIAAVDAVADRTPAHGVGLPLENAAARALVIVHGHVQRAGQSTSCETPRAAPRSPDALRILGAHVPVVLPARSQQPDVGQRVLRLALVPGAGDEPVEVGGQGPAHVRPIGKHEVIVRDPVAVGVRGFLPSEDDVRAVRLASVHGGEGCG